MSSADSGPRRSHGQIGVQRQVHPAAVLFAAEEARAENADLVQHHHRHRHQQHRKQRGIRRHDGRHDEAQEHGVFTVPGEHTPRDHPRHGEQRHGQRQLERTAENQQKFHVEIDIGSDAQLRRDVAIQPEAHEEIDDERQDHEIAKDQSEREQAAGQEKERDRPLLLLRQQGRLDELPTLIEDDRQAEDHRRQERHLDGGEERLRRAVEYELIRERAVQPGDHVGREGEGHDEGGEDRRADDDQSPLDGPDMCGKGIDDLGHDDRGGRRADRRPKTFRVLMGGVLHIVLAIQPDQFRQLVLLRELFFLQPFLDDFLRRREHVALLQFVQFRIEPMMRLFQLPEFMVGLAKPFRDHVFRQHCDTSYVRLVCGD
ncbi:hypothetical protein NITMOv2_1469 [Nitrospira moscoviensis]|uniref:Uncharacterized protein n=1 Tax=Nitrospira moscoviensis TaxID=42253 RepID=A0A0K2GAA1_NITMO|nr:hypothetical protein NITMOv2_1469 [Nitrospira moscoviensis]